MKKNSVFGLALLAGTFAVTPVVADDYGFSDGRISLGGSLGIAESDFKALDDADSEPYIEAFSRYTFSNGLAFDLTYATFGTHENDDVAGTEVDADGFSFQAGYFYEASDLITLYVRAGYFMWDAEGYRLEGSGSGSPTDITFSSSKVYDDDGTDITYGIGIDFNITEHFSLGGSIQHYDMNKDAMDAYAMTGAYHF